MRSFDNLSMDTAMRRPLAGALLVAAIATPQAQTVASAHEASTNQSAGAVDVMTGSNIHDLAIQASDFKTVYSGSVRIQLPDVRNSDSNVEASTKYADQIEKVVLGAKEFITTHQKQGDEIVITGSSSATASDEYTVNGPDANLGKVDPNGENVMIANKYQQVGNMVFAEVLHDQKVTLNGDITSRGTAEIVLLPQQQKEFQRIQTKLGYEDAQQFLRAYKVDPSIASKQDQATMYGLLDYNRSYTATIYVEAISKANSAGAAAETPATPSPAEAAPASVERDQSGGAGWVENVGWTAGAATIIAAGAIALLIARRRRSGNGRTRLSVPVNLPPENSMVATVNSVPAPPVVIRGAPTLTADNASFAASVAAAAAAIDNDPTKKAQEEQDEADRRARARDTAHRTTAPVKENVSPKQSLLYTVLVSGRTARNISRATRQVIRNRRQSK